MSAIFGIVRLDGAEVSPRDLERMGNAMAHRGPDGRKLIAHGLAGLGHCLMRVNNEDLFEAQPLCDREADLTLVADCRIDNRENLARTFGWSDTDCRDRPDSAFILQAYKRWGEGAAEHLLGDFAYAVWDGRAKKLVLARDHMGQRCVHYHHDEKAFVFATEIKALWAVAEVPRTIDEAAIGRRLLRAPPTLPGATFYADILGLPSASVCRVTQDGRHGLQRYWRPAADPQHENRDEAYYVRTYRRLLEEAVTCRLRRLAAPAALYLSGGFDSAAIAGLSAPVMAAQGRRLIGVASVMPEGYRGPLRDPRPWAEACARTMPHLDMHWFVRERETALDNVDGWHLDVGQPALDAHHVLAGLANIAAQSGARLVMDGHGGDFTINPRGYGALARLLRAGRLGRLASEFRANMRFTRRSAWRVFRNDMLVHLLPPGFVHLVRRAKSGFTSLAQERVLAPDFVKALKRAGAIDLERVSGRPTRAYRMRRQMLTSLEQNHASPAYHPDLLAASRGMDFARPFFDKRIIEFGLAVPEDLYVHNGQTRYLARRALVDVYPPEILDRWGPNDPNDPDFPQMYDSILGRLRHEVERIARNPNTARYADVGAMRRVLARRQVGKRCTAVETAALRAILTLYFVEWYEARNR